MHFFIDHTKLPIQRQGNPVPADNDMCFGPNPSTPAAKFDLTTEFLLTQEAKAFSCQNGMMMVQRNDSNITLVNVIIKPTEPTAIKGVNVKYYVYRGIKMSSFFTDNNINPSSNTSNSDFLKSFWENEADVLAADPSHPAATPLNLGYGANSITPHTAPNSLHEDKDIDDIFFGKATAKAAEVKEGMWIGDFQIGTIGFEIVLDTDINVESSLKVFRAASRSLETGASTDLESRSEKEKILAFMDPAAFFGLHYKSGIGINRTTYSSDGKQIKNRTIPGSLYVELICKFKNRHRVYLDIRSERGLSYNFYLNYKISTGNLRNLRLNGATEALAQIYGVDGWPIWFFDNAIITTPSSAKNKVSFRLRINGNTEPVLFIENKDYTYTKDFIRTSSQQIDSDANRKNFFAETLSTETGNANENQWTKEITLYFPHTGSEAIAATSTTPATPAKSNLATHIKIFYFIGKEVSGSDRLMNTHYYDSAFCSIDFEGLGDANIVDGVVENPNPIYIRQPMYVQERLANGDPDPAEQRVDDGAGNFYYAARTGAYWDTTKVLFYCKNLVKRKAADGSGKNYLNTYPKKISLANSIYDKVFKNQFDIICRSYQRTEGDIRIAGINCYTENNVKQEKENLMLLGITPVQLADLKVIAEQLSPLHPRYIFLSPDANNPLTDTSDQHHRYRKYDVKLQGLANDGSPDTVDTALVVYSRDNVFFSSIEFSAQVDLTPGENRVEFHIYHDGIVKINDNIDFSLLRKAKVVDEVTTAAEGSNIPNDSPEQKIRFIHFAQPVGNAASVRTEIFTGGLSVVMANKMKKEGEDDELADGFTEFITYTGVSAERSYTNDDGDIITKERNKEEYTRYNNQKKKAFMVYFIDPVNNGTAANGILTTANNTFGVRLSYGGSRRRFARPDIAAALIGALIKFFNGLTNVTVTTTGFSYGDASCYPSKEHVNGEAIDSLYQGGSYVTSNVNGVYVVTTADPGTEITNGRDKDFILRLNDFGFNRYIVGRHKTGLKTKLNLESALNNKLPLDPYKKKKNLATPDPNDEIDDTVRATLHDNHLHSTNVYIKDAEKPLPS